MGGRRGSLWGKRNITLIAQMNVYSKGAGIRVPRP
jgi:hypothetical protein